jgi:hypothetical protein
MQMHYMNINPYTVQLRLHGFPMYPTVCVDWDDYKRDYSKHIYYSISDSAVYQSIS